MKVGDLDQTIPDGEIEMTIDQGDLVEHRLLDLTIIRTKREMDFHLDGLGPVNSICLPESSWKEQLGWPVIVTGWGVDDFNQSKAILQVAKVTIKSCDYDYDSSKNDPSHDPSYHVCSTDRDIGSRGGDSGGPLFVRMPTGQFELIAIIHGRAELLYTGRSTDVYQALDWIKLTIATNPFMGYIRSV